MKNKTFVLFLSALSFVFSSCSLLPSRTSTDGEVDPPHEETGLGYLKISLNSAGMFSTDYLFVGERGYQYFAKGKLDNGKDAKQYS